MRKPIPLRLDYDAAGLRGLARAREDADQVRRLWALALDAGDIEVWFGDEARIGQKNKITRRWAKRGSRPSDQRTASTYIFGAICLKEGKAVGLIPPWCNTAMMDLHLAAISADVAPGRHAALLLCERARVIVEPE